MKNSITIAGAVLFILMMACNKSNLPAPVAIPNTNTDKYSGSYTGQFEESDNGVDSNGVFKSDSSYAYMLKVQDVGNSKIVITHGPIVLPTVTIDNTNHFAFEDYNHAITGWFSNDSLYLSSTSLNGYYDTIYFVGDWFVIQKLSFKGKKQL